MVNSEGVGGEKDVAGFAASSCRQLSNIIHFGKSSHRQPYLKDFYGRNSLLQVNGPGSDQRLDFRT